MKLRDFLNYVEIQTKVASISPFLLGTLFAVYRYKDFHSVNFIIMLISLIAFDMATTAINNYIDHKKSTTRNSESRLIREGITETMGRTIIFILLAIAVGFGIILTIKTNALVLIIGILSFVVGVLYTFGPIPISRMPLGEIFSGFFMGFIIMFLAIYIQIFDRNIISLLYDKGILSLRVDVLEFIYMFAVSIPAIGGIANIMLANNICDLEEDIINKRFTLPYYLGKGNSLMLFKMLYYIGYIDIIVMIFIGVLPYELLIACITFIPVNKMIKIFYKKQIKAETFSLSVKSFILIAGSQIIIMTGVVLLRFIK